MFLQWTESGVGVFLIGHATIHILLVLVRNICAHIDGSSNVLRDLHDFLGIVKKAVIFCPQKKSRGRSREAVESYTTSFCMLWNLVEGTNFFMKTPTSSCCVFVPIPNISWIVVKIKWWIDLFCKVTLCSIRRNVGTIQFNKSSRYIPITSS